VFEIDLKNRKTIYEQVIDNIRELIILGVIKPDQKLPSVRELSKSLTINPNTVQKAFTELERLGYIYSVAGVGTFARQQEKTEPDKALLDSAMNRISEDIRELFYLGLGTDEIKRRLVEAAEMQGRDLKERKIK